jgi:hypothetical protein
MEAANQIDVAAAALKADRVEASQAVGIRSLRDEVELDQDAAAVAKIHKNSMLPKRCSQPPCMNMAVIIGVIAKASAES